MSCFFCHCCTLIRTGYNSCCLILNNLCNAYVPDKHCRPWLSSKNVRMLYIIIFNTGKKLQATIWDLINLLGFLSEFERTDSWCTFSFEMLLQPSSAESSWFSLKCPKMKVKWQYEICKWERFSQLCVLSTEGVKKTEEITSKSQSAWWKLVTRGEQ